MVDFLSNVSIYARQLSTGQTVPCSSLEKRLRMTASAGDLTDGITGDLAMTLPPTAGTMLCKFLGPPGGGLALLRTCPRMAQTLSRPLIQV